MSNKGGSPLILVKQPVHCGRDPGGFLKEVAEGAAAAKCRQHRPKRHKNIQKDH